MREAYELADAIIAGFSQNSSDFYEGRIQEIADSYSQAQQTWHGAQCLIITAEPSPALYLLECLVDEKTRERKPALCRCIPRYAFDGDMLNGATYWAMRYCLSTPWQDWNVRRLMRLATQIVADAAALNSGGIGGLEIVYYDESGIHLVPHSDCEVFLQEAQDRSNAIRNLILGY
jgi:hypothetical protein